jgi:hypothetical protein
MRRRFGQKPYLFGWEDFVNFARASEAPAQDPRGGYQFYDLTTPWPGVDVPRITPDGMAIIEGPQENLQPRSEDLSAWAQTGTADLISGQTAPDGASDAYLVEDDSVVVIEDRYWSPNLTVSATTPYVLSVMVPKDADNTRLVGVEVRDPVTAHRLWATLNTSTGAISEDAISNGFTSRSVEAIDAGDWWLVRLRYTTASGTAARVVLYPASGLVGGAGRTGTAVGTTIPWGVYLAEVDHPTTYPRTGAAAATRQPDLMDLNSIPAALAARIESPRGFWFDVVSEFGSADTAGSNDYLFDTATPGAASFAVRRSAPGSNTLQLIQGGTIGITLPTATWVHNDRLRFWVKNTVANGSALKVWNMTQGKGPFSGTGASQAALDVTGKKLRIGGLGSLTTVHWNGLFSRWVAGHP